MAEAPLTEKQLRFCREYAANPNGTRAYMRAFSFNSSYSSAAVHACELLKQSNIQEEIKAARREYMRRVGLSAVKVLRGLVEIAFADQDDCYEEDPDNGCLPKPRKWGDIPPATRRAMQSVKIKRRKLKSKDSDSEAWELEEIEYKFPDKNVAFDRLCKHLGLTKDDMTEAAAEMVKVLRVSADVAAQLESGTPDASHVVNEAPPAT